MSLDLKENRRGRGRGVAEWTPSPGLWRGRGSGLDTELLSSGAL